ncbi:Flagellar hook-associated protein 2 [Novipirellula aureliae]|uniref:Filament cap protein n=1 Tax=Novipirellula aureliae TaxID=2527966 RepID=A0A5C6E354_9BACT|nr:flagellar filament capping protein FliD [Novipirellula aureliae]TWU41579.1 Flagellar hook-associated protein 2 [Novipirellula aureliae]
MGRIQSSVGLVTGTDIVGTVDQLIAISAQPRDRVSARNEALAKQQQSIAELTASVIGVQLSGNRLANSSLFRSKSAESSNSDVISATGGNKSPVGTHTIETLQTAATHDVRSLQRFDSVDTALGLSGQIRINPGSKLLDDSVKLSELNEGRGVEAGVIRITDRSGATADIDLSKARTMDDVLQTINDANIGVRATTVGNAFKLVDETGSTANNLKVEQLGSAETAADIGLWGIDEAASSVTGIDLELPDGVNSLRGAALSELGGGSGIGPLGDLSITLSDGQAATIDLSSATTSSEVIDLIDASGLPLIAKLNDAKNGFQIRDVSGGEGNFKIESADDTASQLGLVADTTDQIVVGKNLNRQTVTLETKLTELNRGNGVGTGSFLVTDSKGVIGAVSISGDEIETVGDLVDAINNLSNNVTASINEAGDGISIVDSAGGTKSLAVRSSGTSEIAENLGIAGTATDHTIGGQTVKALVGTQADVIEIEEEDTLASIVEKINSEEGYAKASIRTNDDGSYSLQIRSIQGGEAGKLAIDTSGFNLDLRTQSTGRDALVSVSTDGGVSQFMSSSDGVFEMSNSFEASKISRSTNLADMNDGLGISSGSILLTDSLGKSSGINLVVQNITSVGEFLDAINSLGIGVSASINDDGTGITIIDTAGGSETLEIEDVGNGKAATDLGIAGTATTTTIDGVSVSALTSSIVDTNTTETQGLSFTLKELSDSPITITVKDDASTVTNAAQTFVDQYNKLHEKLESLTFYNADTEEVGLLFGSNETYRIRDGYSRLLSGTISQAGDFKSLAQVGIGFDETGKLELDSDKLSSAMVSDPSAVEAFFTTDETGLADRLSSLADKLAGPSTSLLLTRTETLGTQMEKNNERIEQLNERLDNERERLLKQFYATETAIGKLQTNSNYISQIERIEFPTS